MPLKGLCHSLLGCLGEIGSGVFFFPTFFASIFVVILLYKWAPRFGHDIDNLHEVVEI